MNFRIRQFFWGLLCLLLFSCPLVAQSADSRPGAQAADLQLVIVLSRHGVRSPLTPQAELDRYSAVPWPRWDVAPGIQTAHGDELIRILGSWDRAKFADEGFLTGTGCSDAARVSLIADNDQRTRATGKALVETMFPGCAIPEHSLPDGQSDPLFRTMESGLIHVDSGAQAAAIAGRLGGSPGNLTEAYRSQLELLDHVLAECGRGPANPKRASIFDVPASVTGGPGVLSGSLHGPVIEGATLAENLLLEYTQGMSDTDTGWGCLDAATLRKIMQLDTASWDYGKRTPAFARAYASNLLDRIRRTMEQSASGKQVKGALGKRGDRMVILVGHDSNIVTVAGALGINWVLDGRVDDTPPGGALFFELWRARADGKPFVRLEYRAQTLEQMRKAEPLTAANPPTEARISVPGCSGSGMACSWDEFDQALRRAIDAAEVVTQP